MLQIQLSGGLSSPWPAPLAGCSSWERLRARRDSSEVAGKFYVRQQQRVKDLLLPPAEQAAFLSVTAGTALFVLQVRRCQIVREGFSKPKRCPRRKPSCAVILITLLRVANCQLPFLCF